MTTFTFTQDTADRLMNDLNAGLVVRLTKSNRSAIVLQHGNDTDEFGDETLRFTIEHADQEPIVKNVPMSQEDMLNFLYGEEFAEYEIVEK